VVIHRKKALFTGKVNSKTDKSASTFSKAHNASTTVKQVTIMHPFCCDAGYVYPEFIEGIRQLLLL